MGMDSVELVISAISSTTQDRWGRAQCATYCAESKTSSNCNAFSKSL
ncbi:hypothetical protein COLO4_12583 [Corchorus olitorius]|uniref:Uncharacterized protein n=1 Tax=Corchorus olitorius TaxID=93759 RepID=A0A1R3K0E5_9ROSI|nr:hypothetical protein COLO4_12583 [Corchorus olitorius]